ncbi:hypothetical protein SAMN05192583_0872 [Sphingomonas gellani]|uniref:Uncharacterized protein n=1 Tax=Sphingomonas gellani TaxID=1166340 RepID=A0A1H7ZVV7_9SPHN|nr:hypothetical protein [Sphingomonas gellani]SEM62423.1 hypothetical protein SAMN05192583_0872 [Sphingomonas gellani]
MMAALPLEQIGDEACGVVASVARIDAWMELAKAGDRFVYASRLTLPVASAGAKRMRDLAKRELVLLTRPRSTIDPTVFNYTATRSSKPSPLTKPDREKLKVVTLPIDIDEVEAVNSLLPVLERFARAGRPCPTDHQLAQRADLSVDLIKPILKAAEAAHMIRVLPAPGPTGRRILILSTGAITGLVR